MIESENIADNAAINVLQVFVHLKLCIDQSKWEISPKWFMQRALSLSCGNHKNAMPQLKWAAEQA